MKKIQHIFSLMLAIISSVVTMAQTEVGTLPGSLGVTPSGAATYTIPIDLPAGRANMKPHMALVYNNQAPSNIMGQGWGISGFSSIGRVNPTKYFNDEVDNVDFVDDQLMLDGKRLIKIGTEGGNIIYRTEVDEFSKIVYHPSGESGDYFVVFSKNGQIKEYGETSNSRQYYSAPANKTLLTESPLIWHLNKIYDRQGNSVKYFYEGDISSGELHPSRIEYTHDENSQLGEFSYSVEFKYESLPDENLHQMFYYEKSGDAYKNENIRRLTAIEVFHQTDNTSPIKVYDLNYSLDPSFAGEYFLESVELSATDPSTGETSVYNPTQFDWTFYTPNHQLNATEFDEGFKVDPFFYKPAYKIVGLDVDGDGRSEIADFKEEYVSDSQDPISTVTLHWFNTGETFAFDPGYSDRINSLSGADFDNDGDEEMIVTWDDSLKIYNFSQTGGNWTKTDKFTYGKSGAYLQSFAGDFNGDGLTDLLIVDEKAGEAVLNIGAGDESNYFDSNTITFTFTPDDELIDIISIADFNGDGKTDLVLEERTNRRDQNGDIDKIKYDFKVITLTGQVFDTLFKHEVDNEKALTHNDDFYFVDLNGDGRFDIHHQLAPKPGQTDTIFHTAYHSYGKGLIMHNIERDNQWLYTPSLYLMDMNNDGRADWVYLEFGTDLEGQFIRIKTYYAHPNGLSLLPVEQVIYASPSDFEGADLFGLTFADISGNGITDLAIGFLEETQTSVKSTFN